MIEEDAQRHKTKQVIITYGYTSTISGKVSRGSHGTMQRGAQKYSNKMNGKPKKDQPKKSLTDYNYYLGSAKQASDYQTTTEFRTNYIVKTFDFGDDISKAL